jgi:transposase
VVSALYGSVTAVLTFVHEAIPLEFALGAVLAELVLASGAGRAVQRTCILLTVVPGLAATARSDCQDRADWLTPNRLDAWLKSVHYTGHSDPAILHARLLAAPRGATGEDDAAHTCITRALVVTSTSLVTQINTPSKRIGEQLASHADAHMFTSLPRSGTIRAARLLAEIGDCRAQFPTPEAVIGLAGVAPSTRQSGRKRSVSFRWAGDQQLRDAVCDFVNDSRHANPWAADLYNRARAPKRDHLDATRILARAWLHVIWHCWQTNTAYDPAKHRALQALLEQHQQSAA